MVFTREFSVIYKVLGYMENKDEIGWDLVAQAKNIIVSPYLNDSLIRKKRILEMKCEQLNIVTYVYL